MPRRKHYLYQDPEGRIYLDQGAYLRLRQLYVASIGRVPTNGHQAVFQEIQSDSIPFIQFLQLVEQRQRRSEGLPNGYRTGFPELMNRIRHTPYSEALDRIRIFHVRKNQRKNKHAIQRIKARLGAR